MVHRVAIGIDDFRTLRESGLEYVDKTDLIRGLLDRPGVLVSLFPRPRRFGKSLNLSMLRAWFEKRDEDLSHLFRDLSIWQAGDEYRAHFQRYPVIYFNFKGSKASSFALCERSIREKIIDLYAQHRAVLDGGKLNEIDARRYREILGGTADPALFVRALLDLSSYLSAHHGEKVVILIDEYDEPIHAGHVHGYSGQILDFMRLFLGEGLKSNPHLFKAVVTGILRVAKENLFSGLSSVEDCVRSAADSAEQGSAPPPLSRLRPPSGALNNLGVYSLLRREMHTCFGFTEAEVVGLLTREGRADKLEEVRAWYNGYLFGGEVIYNPWSILCFLDSADASLEPYWLSTSSNDLVRELLELHAFNYQPFFQTLLEGGSIVRNVEENVVLGDIRTYQDSLWSLLLFSGYLKAERRPVPFGEPPAHALSIPNREVRSVYSGTFRRWMGARMEGHGGGVDRLTRALLKGDVEAFEEQLQAFVTNVLSYHDPGNLDPERVYQGFLVGLLAVLEPDYEVRSNRESGAGRPDVWIRPRKPGNPGIVMELKVARPRRRTLAQALSQGLTQLTENDYGAELRAAGATPVFAFAVAFDGKEVRVASPKARRAAPKARAAAPKRRAGVKKAAGRG